MARLQLKIWRAPLATLKASLGEGEIGIASETNTLYKRPDGSPTAALIPVSGGGVTTLRARVAATGNVGLAGLQTIDGITVAAGDLVLCPNQTTASQNGLYVAASGAWTRAAGADSWSNLVSALYVVEQGTALGDTVWLCTSDSGGTLGTTAVTFQTVNNRTGALFSALTPIVDGLPYFNTTSSMAIATLTSFGRSLIDDANAGAARTTLGISAANTPFTAVGGIASTNVQDAVAELDTEKAPIASPALTGVPTAPTALANTNTTQLATTAFVMGQISTTTPSALGTAAVGTGTTFARADHVHAMPTASQIPSAATGDVSATNVQAAIAELASEKAPLASPALTGTPTAPTAALGTSSTQLATTAFVATAVSSAIGGGSTGSFSTVTVTGASDLQGNVTIGGNLTVNGSTTTVNSTVTTLDDPVITLGGDTAPLTDDSKDRGVEFRWHNGTTAKRGFFGFDDSTGFFTFIPDATNASEVFSGTKGTLDAYLNWSNVTAKPTTLAGYGITDAQASNASLDAIAALSGTSGLLKKTGASTWALDTNAYITGNQSITLSGDASGTGTTAISVTLANSGVTAGTYNNSATAVTPITVDAKGRVTATGTAVTITPAWSSITGKPTTIAGYGITDAASATHNHTGTYQPLDTDLTAIAGLAGTSGFLKKTGAGTWALDTTNYAKLDVVNTWTKTQAPVGTSLTDAATIAWDGQAQQVTEVTLTNTRTMGAMTNVVPKATYVVIVRQDSTGFWSLAWNSMFKFVNGITPNLTGDPGTVDIFTFVANSAGTELYCVGVSKNLG